MKWILASASPRRRDILQQHGIAPVVMPAHIPEIPTPDETGQNYALRLARQKAQAIAQKMAPVSENTIVLAADTIVLLNEKILEKPADAAHAFAMLKSLSGRTHQVLTAFCLIELPQQKQILDFAVTDVTFHDLSDEQIQNYIATGDPLDKAGGYGIQTVQATFVKAILGSKFNVMGLPWEKILEKYNKIK